MATPATDPYAAFSTPVKPDPYAAFSSPVAAPSSQPVGGQSILGQSGEIPSPSAEQLSADERRKKASRLPSFGARLSASGSVEPGTEDSQAFYAAQNKAQEDKFVAENTAPDGVPLDIRDQPDWLLRFSQSMMSPQEKLDALQKEGRNPRVSADGEHIILRAPDGKKDVLYSGYDVVDIAGNIAPVLTEAGKVAAGTLVGNPAIGAVARGSAIATVPLSTLISGGSGTQAGLETALTAAPLAAPALLRGGRRLLAGGGVTPIETRGGPALSRLTGEAVPAEIATGRPVLARAANAPITGNYPQTKATIDSALAAEQYRMAGDVLPQAQLRQAVEGAIKGEGGYLDTARKAFSAREQPILAIAAETGAKPTLSKTSQYVEGVLGKYGKQEAGGSAGEAFNRAVSDIQRKQGALAGTKDLTIDNLLANRRALDDAIDFDAADDVSRDILKGYRDAINDDIEATLKAIPKAQQTAFAKANNGQSPAVAFRANNEAFTEALEPVRGRAIRSALAPGSNPEKLFTYLRGDGSDAKSITDLYQTLDDVAPETASSLRQGVLGDVINDVRAKPPANVDASQFNRVNADKLDELLGRRGGEIVNKDARAKYEALVGNEGITFLDDLADASRMLEKSDELSEGGKLTSPKVFTKELVAAKSGVLSQGARAAVDIATAIPRMATGAALRNPAVNRFLATGELPAFIGRATQAASAAGAVAPSLLSQRAETLPTSSPLGSTLSRRMK